MQSQFARPRRKKMAEINVVPYIDVMLVLLIIFMVTAPLITAGVKVDLPHAEADPLEANEETPIIATVDEGGQYYIDDKFNQPMSLDELIDEILAKRGDNNKIPVVVNGDAKTDYEKVIQLMVALREEVGVEQVGLMTDPIE